MPQVDFDVDAMRWERRFAEAVVALMRAANLHSLDVPFEYMAEPEAQWEIVVHRNLDTRVTTYERRRRSIQCPSCHGSGQVAPPEEG